MWPLGVAIFGPRGIIWTNLVGPLGDATYQISKL